MSSVKPATRLGDGLEPLDDTDEWMISNKNNLEPNKEFEGQDGEWPLPSWNAWRKGLFLSRNVLEWRRSDFTSRKFD